MIVIVIGGIISGIFTATGGGGCCAGLIMSLFFYKSIKLSELPKIFLDSAEMTGINIFLIGVSSIMSWVMAFYGIRFCRVRGHAGNQQQVCDPFIINILLLIIGIHCWT